MASDVGASVILLSEPNVARLDATWIKDSEGDTAIKVLGEARSRMTKWGSPEQGIVWCKIGEIVLYSCYASPNAGIANFEDWLNALEHSVREHHGKVLVTGDFNAKSPHWGSAHVDARGTAVAGMMASLDLHTCNEGSHPTFTRGQYGSIIDLTLASTPLMGLVQGWEVSDRDSLSDHHYITYMLDTDPPQATRRSRSRIDQPRWQVSRTDVAYFTTLMSEGTIRHLGAQDMAEEYMKKLVATCKGAVPRSGPTNGRNKRVYWWCPAVAAARTAANSARRKATRARRSGSIPDLLLGELRSTRNDLRTEITRSKERCWRELCDQVETDPWGLPYKLVAKKLGTRSPGPEVMVTGGTRRVIQELFPVGPPVLETLEDYGPTRLANVTPWTPHEVEMAARRMPNRKAPGPDGIPNELLKMAVAVSPEHICLVLNQCLAEGLFPPRWKKARLVLIPKGGRNPEDPSAYRPLCLLDGAGKLLERLLADRLEEEIERTGGLSPCQFGFRRGRSTVHAIKSVGRIAAEANEGPLRKRRHCVLVALDVRNAFNSLPWTVILKTLKDRGVTSSLTKMVHSYLEDRTFVYMDAGREVEARMTGGVPQGSVLGPLLWNLVYDEVLRLKLPLDATAIAFADDIAVVVRAHTVELLRSRAASAVETINNWMGTTGLALAEQKTQAVWLSTKRSGRGPREVLTLLGKDVAINKTMKYLGVVLEANPRHSAHVAHAASAAAKTASAVARLMPNLRGPGEARRRLLAGVATAKLLYAAPAWSRSVEVNRNCDRLRSVTRTGALRIARAYRTVSTEAIEVLASTIPPDLLVSERDYEWALRQEGAPRSEAKREVRMETVEKWQIRWASSTKGSWTRRLIPDIEPWISRQHGELSHWLTQLLTGHGCFGSYLARIKKTEDGECRFCGEDVDDAEHTLSYCPAWTADRELLEVSLGKTVDPTTLVDAMLESQGKWRAVGAFAKSVLRAKDQAQRGEEADRQTEARTRVTDG